MTRTAVISQPTYLPWIGYLRLVAAADVFVFLDDVQFARRSWQSRNRILGPAGEQMLTIPVRKADRAATIAKIMIVNEGGGWWEKHLASIRHAYQGRPGFAEGYPFIDAMLRREEWRLADFNIGLIEALARKLGLTTAFARASALGCGGARSEHLLALCRAVGATEYLSTAGSADYMAEDGVFEAAGFPVRFINHQPVPYPQGRESFTPYMSFLDALMNLGWDGLRRLVVED
jgi:hypothetical protein